MTRLIITYLAKPFRTILFVAVSVALVVLILSSSLGPGFVHLARQAIDNLTARVLTVRAPAPVIVEQLQALNRLESARQVSRHVVEARSESNVLPAFLSKDELLMLVQTEAVAGIDLSRLSGQDVQVKGDTVTLHLPSPQIFFVRIEDKHSRVYQRSTGWLVFNPDKDLERQARLKAQSDAKHTARHSGVLSAAKANAEDNLRALLQALGFHKVEFHWKDAATPPADTAAASDSMPG